VSAAPLVLDASVLVKIFMQEPGSAAARALAGEPRALIGPEITAVEVASAVVRRFRAGAIARADADALLDDARQFFAQGSVLLTEDAALQARAEQIALDIRHALVDCLYIAAAEKAGGELVTADETLVARAAPVFPFVRILS
jgi:predicted nucleic acid-binding protein